MKRKLIFLFLAFWCIGCTSEFEVLNSPASPTQTPLTKRFDEKVLSEDPAIAERSLKLAAEKRDMETIRMGLRSALFSIKLRSAELIAESNDLASIPDLAATLTANRSVIDGGTEIQIQQNEFNILIVDTLQKFLNKEFSVSERLGKSKLSGYSPLTDKELAEIQSAVKEWKLNNK